MTGASNRDCAASRRPLDVHSMDPVHFELRAGTILRAGELPRRNQAAWII